VRVDPEGFSQARICGDAQAMKNRPAMRNRFTRASSSRLLDSATTGNVQMLAHGKPAAIRQGSPIAVRSLSHSTIDCNQIVLANICATKISENPTQYFDTDFNSWLQSELRGHESMSRKDCSTIVRQLQLRPTLPEGIGSTVNDLT